MPKVKIINPIPGGMKYTSQGRARQFCRNGLAIMTQDGQLMFREMAQQRISRELTEQEEFDRNRDGILFWNGARSRYVGNRDVSMFPPGSNVVFPKTGTARAARRYQ